MTAKSDARPGLETIWDFADEFLVLCPRCGGRAAVRVATPAAPRLACEGCGLIRTFTEGSAAPSSRAPAEPFDPYFHAPLWLQVRCGGHVLWACNERHLHFLRDYVGARNRRGPTRGAADPRNALLESRLPRWLKSARNRDAVLVGLAAMQAALDGASGSRKA